MPSGAGRFLFISAAKFPVIENSKDGWYFIEMKIKRNVLTDVITFVSTEWIAV